MIADLLKKKFEKEKKRMEKEAKKLKERMNGGQTK